MQNSIEDQIRFLSAVFFSGMMCGFIYDILRVRRKLLCLGNLCVNIEDVIFCVFTGIVFLTVTFYLNSGIVRISGFFCLLGGEFTYFILLRNRMRNLLIFLIEKLLKILSILIRIIIFPVMLVKRLVRKPVYIAVWYAGGKIRKTKNKYNILKNRLKNHLKLVTVFARKTSKKH